MSADGRTWRISHSSLFSLRPWPCTCLQSSADRFISRGLDLALALANRSACLQRGKFFRKAVEDIDLAIDCGYPK